MQNTLMQTTLIVIGICAIVPFMKWMLAPLPARHPKQHRRAFPNAQGVIYPSARPSHREQRAAWQELDENEEFGRF